MAVDQIRYRRLGYVGLNVADLARSRDFYVDTVGLTLGARSTPDAAYLRCSDRHHDMLLVEGAAPGLKRLGWQLESDQAFAAAHDHFTRIGLAPQAVATAEAAEFAISDAFRIVEPTTGATFEFYVNMASAEAPYTPTHTKIARLGHVVLNTVDRPSTEAFLLDEMNFRVSDRIDGVVSFMRCFPNPYHHSFGVGSGPRNSLNHLNFMVTDLDDVGRGYNRMKARQVPIVFGPGKHPPSESVFLYFLDPDGITVEYSFGMEEFPEVTPRVPRMMPASIASIDYWEGAPDPAFAKVGDIERLAR